MTVALYMDQHVPMPITRGLRQRGVDVMTANDDGASMLDGLLLLDRSTMLRRVLFTRDRDLLIEAARRLEQGMHFEGVVFAHQQWVSIGTCIQNLELIAKVAEPQELQNTVLFLPL